MYDRFLRRVIKPKFHGIDCGTNVIKASRIGEESPPEMSVSASKISSVNELRGVEDTGNIKDAKEHLGRPGNEAHLDLRCPESANPESRGLQSVPYVS